jgi:hypothetical protein
MNPAEEKFAALVETMLTQAGVTYGADDPSKSKKFGASGLKIRNKIFAMLVQGNLVVKLPKQRVEKLIAAGDGEPFDVGERRMREWLTVSQQADWQALAEEALVFVDSKT